MADAGELEHPKLVFVKSTDGGEKNGEQEQQDEGDYLDDAYICASGHTQAAMRGVCALLGETPSGRFVQEQRLWKLEDLLGAEWRPFAADYYGYVAEKYLENRETCQELIAKLTRLAAAQRAREPLAEALPATSRQLSPAVAGAVQTAIRDCGPCYPGVGVAEAGGAAEAAQGRAFAHPAVLRLCELVQCLHAVGRFEREALVPLDAAERRVEGLLGEAGRVGPERGEAGRVDPERGEELRRREVLQ